MNQTNRPVRKGSRVLLGVIISVLAAALAPVLLATSSIAFVYPIITLFVYAYAGMGAAITSICANILAFDLYFAQPGLIVSVAAFTLPAVIMMRGVKWKMPVSLQMRSAITAGILGMAATLVGLRIYLGKDIIDVFVELLRKYMELEAPGALDLVLVRVFNSDLLPSSIDAQQLADGLLSAEQRASYLDAFAGQLNNMLALSLPGMLISSASVTAISGVQLANWMLRKQPDRKMCYLPVGRWYTPWQVSLGLSATFLFTLILDAFGLKGADILYTTVLTLLRTVFIIQAIISINRHMLSVGKRTWSRVLLIAAMIIFVPTAAVIYGSISAIFGVHGAFRQLRARKKRGSGNNDI